MTDLQWAASHLLQFKYVRIVGLFHVLTYFCIISSRTEFSRLLGFQDGGPIFDAVLAEPGTLEAPPGYEGLRPAGRGELGRTDGLPLGELSMLIGQFFQLIKTTVNTNIVDTLHSIGVPCELASCIVHCFGPLLEHDELQNRTQKLSALKLESLSDLDTFYALHQLA